LCAQSLESRILSSGTGTVAFDLPARPGVCGDGRSWIRIGGDTWVGSFNDATRLSPCESGPVRVRVQVVDREVMRLDTRVGPVVSDDATALGRASAAEALTFLGGLARRADGRLARDAVFALGVADSMDSRPVLRAVASDGSRARDVRRSALSWFARLSAGATAEQEGIDLATQLASSEDEHQQLRSAAVAQLARWTGGVPRLVELSGSERDPWLARQATEQLGKSGDPRGRRTALEIALNPARSSELRTAALSGLSGEAATLAEVRLVMKGWSTMTTDRLSDAALSMVASTGGREAHDFLLRLVRDEVQPARTRRRAASLLDRAGVTVAEVLTLYDSVSDGEVRTQLVDVLAQAGTREAVARLARIAREETQPIARRRAIAALGRRDDQASREALRGIVER
jgi:hypothetical protein